MFLARGCWPLLHLWERLKLWRLEVEVHQVLGLALRLGPFSRLGMLACVVIDRLRGRLYANDNRNWSPLRLLHLWQSLLGRKTCLHFLRACRGRPLPLSSRGFGVICYLPHPATLVDFEVLLDLLLLRELLAICPFQVPSDILRYDCVGSLCARVLATHDLRVEIDLQR